MKNLYLSWRILSLLAISTTDQATISPNILGVVGTETVLLGVKSVNKKVDKYPKV
jgi:hypothetical protein